MNTVTFGAGSFLKDRPTSTSIKTVLPRTSFGNQVDQLTLSTSPKTAQAAKIKFSADFDGPDRDLQNMASSFDRALGEYNNDRRRASSSEKMMGMLEAVETTLHDGGARLEDETRRSRFARAFSRAWDRVSAEAQRANPAFRAIANDVNTLEQMLKTHRGLLRQIDQQFNQLNAAGLVDKNRRREYERTRNRINQDISAVAQALSGKGALFAPVDTFLAIRYGTDVLRELGRGHLRSQELTFAREGCKESVQKAKRHYGLAFRAAKTGIGADYSNNLRTLANLYRDIAAGARTAQKAINDTRRRR